MLFANTETSEPKPAFQPFSLNVLENYKAPLDCLTAHLVLECSSILAVVKPASLVSLVNLTRSCGRNLYQLWKLHHEDLTLRHADLTLVMLQSRPQAVQLSCYNHNHLERHLFHGGISTLLYKAGYKADASCTTLVAGQSKRIAGNSISP